MNKNEKAPVEASGPIRGQKEKEAADHSLTRPVDSVNGLDQFQAEAEAVAGLVFNGAVIADGKIHRVGTTGKESGQDGAYLFHADGQASGWFKNYRTGVEQTWTARNGKPLSPAEKETLRARIQADKNARREEERQRHAEARAKAVGILKDAPQCPAEHPYLERKGIQPHGVRQGRDGQIIVAVLDEKGAVMSLQFIGPNGQKLFLPGGKIRGGYYVIGKDKAGKLYIAEGFATAASIHEATEATVLVAFNAGNLAAVAVFARAKYPNRQIIVCADDDHKTPGNPGIAKATEAAREAGALLAVPVFAKPGTGTDFNDLHAAEGLEAVKVCLDAAGEPGESGQPMSAPSARKLVALDIATFLARDFPARGSVLSPVIPTQGLVLLYASRGIGKTFVGLSIAYAVASGQSVMRWTAPSARRVLYLDGEMPANVMKERLASIVAGFDLEPPDPSYLTIITPDLQPESMPNLATTEGQAALADYLDGVELVVIDNLATLARHGRENEAESWLPVQGWILELRRRGISVLLVHHAAKGGQQRGTSSREDVLDTVISLRRPDDYQAQEGARFEVHLEKARGICGSEAKPFEAKLIEVNGGLVWTTADIEDVELRRVLELKAEGLSIRDIAEETKISRSRVQRMLKKMGEAA